MVALMSMPVGIAHAILATEGRGMFNYRYKGFSLYDNIRFSADKYRETSTQEVFIGNGYLFSDEESRWNGLDFRNRLSVSSQFSTGQPSEVDIMWAQTV